MYFGALFLKHLLFKNELWLHLNHSENIALALEQKEGKTNSILFSNNQNNRGHCTQFQLPGMTEQRLRGLRYFPGNYTARPNLAYRFGSTGVENI